jgi:hypothetical protein
MLYTKNYLWRASSRKCFLEREKILKLKNGKTVLFAEQLKETMRRRKFNPKINQESLLFFESAKVRETRFCMAKIKTEFGLNRMEIKCGVHFDDFG